MIDEHNPKYFHFIPDLQENLPRVTQITKIIAKGEAFENWLKTQGNKAKELLETAGDIGSSFHNRAEEIGKGIQINLDALKPQERTWVDEFLKWKDLNVKRFIETEQLVWHNVEGYSGTLDALVELNNGKLAVLDYKTSKYIYPEHHLQVSAYLKAYEWTHSIKVDTAIILKFDKTGKAMQVKEIEAIDEVFKVFLCALRIWEWKYGLYRKETEVKGETDDTRESEPLL